MQLLVSLTFLSYGKTSCMEGRQFTMKVMFVIFTDFLLNDLFSMLSGRIDRLARHN